MKRKILVSILILSLLLSVVPSIFPTVSASPGTWWNEDWDSRKTFGIQGTAGAGTDYQMKFVVRTGEEVIVISDEHKDWALPRIYGYSIVKMEKSNFFDTHWRYTKSKFAKLKLFIAHILGVRSLCLHLEVS